MAGTGELAHHDLGIDEVLRASETDKTNFQEAAFFRPLSSNVTVVQPALLEILLVIFLSAPELDGGHDLGHDGPRETALRGVAGGARLALLRRRVIENDRAVLRAYVRSLTVQRCRAVVVPEDFEQVVVADDLGV